MSRNTDGKTPLDLAEGAARQVLLGEYRKDELLEAARTGNEERFCQLITPLNVNCTASDGNKNFRIFLFLYDKQGTIRPKRCNSIRPTISLFGCVKSLV